MPVLKRSSVLGYDAKKRVFFIGHAGGEKDSLSLRQKIP